MSNRSDSIAKDVAPTTEVQKLIAKLTLTKEEEKALMKWSFTNDTYDKRNK